jgi:hypothetical protein
MLVFGMLRSSNFIIDCSCIAPLTPAVMVIRGFIFYPLLCMVLISGSYLACFCVMACSGNLSWQYVNSMNCIIFVCDGARGVGMWLGTPKIHRMFGLSLAWHWHLVCGHVHSMSQYGTICSWILLLVLSAFVNV